MCSARAAARHPGAEQEWWPIVRLLVLTAAMTECGSASCEQCAASGQVSLRELQEWVGHRDARTTQIYADYMAGEREAELIDTISALTDLGALFAIAQLGAEEFGVPLGEGGVHAGEWETSMLMAIHPDLVALELGEPGYTGDAQAALGAIFGTGVHTVAENGVIGDPRRASAEHGKRYWDKVLGIALAAVG